MRTAPMEDLEALTQYARSGSEEAFALVARRYTDLIYSAALRQVREPHAAEDVTQAVLMILMKKAGTFQHGTILAGWLLKVTRYVAQDAIKMDARRRFHERHAAAAQTEIRNDEASEPSPDWQQLSLILDESLLRLRPADRDAITLRYLLGKTPDEVATALKISGPTARKRVSRALDRLRRILARRGLLTQQDVLSATLATNAIIHAPPNWIFLPSQAISPLAQTTLRSIAAAKTKLVTTGVVLSLSAGVAAALLTRTAIRTLAPPTSPSPPAIVTATIARALSHPNMNIASVALSPDGQTLLTGGGTMFNNAGTIAPSELRLWNLQTGAEIAQLHGHVGRIASLAFRPGFNQVLSAADDGTIRLWDLSTGSELRQFTAGLVVSSMAATPDGHSVLSGGHILTATQFASIVDRTSAPLRLWDLETGQDLNRFPTIHAGVSHLALSPTGTEVAVSVDAVPPQLLLCSLDSPKPRYLNTSSATITALCFSPDGQRLAVACQDGSLLLFNTQTAKRLAVWRIQQSPIRAIVFSPNGQQLFTAGGLSHQSIPAETPTSNPPDFAIHIIDTQTCAEISQLPGHTTGVSTLALSTDGARLISAGGKELFICNLSPSPH